MTEKNETAEAIFIVIKRIAKWLLYGMLGLITLLGMIWGIYEIHTYWTIGLPESKVEVSLKFAGARCKDDKNYPVLLRIINRSNKTILKTVVYAEARREGRSTNLAKAYEPISVDNIIEPGGGWGVCARPSLEDSLFGCDYSGKNCKYTYENIVGKLIWSVDSYSIRFE